MRHFMFTKEEAWLKKWDVFVFENPKGSHLLFSDWLASYASYGFDYEVGLVLEGDTIIGGCGVVIPKFLFFKFYIIPHGPIYRKNDEQNLVDHLKAIMKHAIDIGACYMQMSVPITSHKDLREYTYNNTLTALLCDLNIEPGKLFNYVYSSYGLNWVDLRGFKNADDFLEQLTPKVRRNIRLPYNKQASPRFLTKLTDIEQAYIIITQNANNDYYARPVPYRTQATATN